MRLSVPRSLPSRVPGALRSQSLWPTFGVPRGSIGDTQEGAASARDLRDAPAPVWARTVWRDRSPR